jgi:hypothetical protein
VSSNIQARPPGVAVALLVACAVAGPAAAGAGAAPHKKHHGPTPETLLARKVLLHRSDLGFQWTSTPASGKTPTLICPAFSPNVTSLPKPGAAASPTFSRAFEHQFVFQAAYVYPTAKQALTFWNRAVTPKLVKCVAGALTANSTSSVTFAVTSKHSLQLPAIGDRRAGYRVAGTATQPGGEVNVYLDMLVVGRGSGLTQVSFLSLFEPVSRSLELRLARVAAARLPSDSGAPKG